MRSSIVLCSILIVTCIHAHPNGAPKTACKHMTPNHENSVAQTGSSPFTITADSEAGGKTVTVTIATTSKNTFKGFLITARAPADVASQSGKNLGQFYPMDDSQSQTLTCDSTADAITHVKNDDKPSLSFQWSPGNYSGNVLFTGTVVQDFETYFMGVKSEAIEVKSARRRR